MKIQVLAAAMLLSATLSASAWKPAEVNIMTPWGENLAPKNVHPEYPRPQMKRADWQNLNGLWQYAITPKDSAKPASFQGEILVPFAPQSALSGVGRPVTANDALWYERTFRVPSKWLKEHVMLNFGAVDWKAEVWVNDVKIGEHTGGYTPFSLDITNALKSGDNTLTVKAWDPGQSVKHPIGKQQDVAEIMYTNQSGIWQTVWMEYVPTNYIRNLKLTPDVDNGKLDIVVSLEGGNSAIASVTAAASFAGEKVSETAAAVTGKEASFSLPIPDAKLWEPGNPNLYDLTVTAGEDTVCSYFGMRSVRINGYAIEINNKPVYQRLVLDQGYYPDGIYTAPTDDDLKRDIELSMAVGFNGARLHMKIFEPRLLYHADKMGYLLWGEFPNWGLDESKAASLLSILPEWLTELERDYNHPAIVGWCPFNETGARRNKEVFRTVYHTTRAIDPMRPIIDTSGYVHVITDIYDVHDYDQNPETFRARYVPLETGEGEIFRNNPREEVYEGQPYFVSEFGGTYWNIDEDPSAAWGYGQAPKTIEEFYERFEGLINVLLDNSKMCAFCYTQLTDVFQEKNGIYAFDRRAKFDAERLHRIMTRKAAIEK